VTLLGTLRLRLARTREKSFLPHGLDRFQRRAEDVPIRIREAFLRGTSTQQVGRVVVIQTGEVVGAQTVSKLTRDLDEAVRQIHETRMSDDYAYLISGWSELARAAPGGTRAGADAGGLWGAARRHSPFAGLPAQPGRVRRGGKDCCRMCTGVGWKPNTSRRLSPTFVQVWRRPC